MLKAIVEKSEGRIFYGTRSAGYDLPFVSKTEINVFADDLETEIIKINHQGKRDEYLKLLNNYKYVEIGEDELRLKNELRDALNGFENVQIMFEPHNKILANLIARFSSDSPHKNRLFEIYPIGIPNEFFWFDPSPLYKLGEKYGVLERGEDFNISIRNYRKVEDP